MVKLASETSSKSKSYLYLFVGALSRCWQIEECSGRQNHIADGLCVICTYPLPLNTQHYILKYSIYVMTGGNVAYNLQVV